MTDEGNQLKKALFGDTLLIAAVSFYGYCLSVSFEAGYNAYFNIPAYFIPFDLVSILLSIFFTVGTLISCFSIVRMIGWFNPPENSNDILRNKLLGFTTIVVFILFALLLTEPSRVFWLVALFLVLFIALLWFGLPLLGRPKNIPYRDKLVAHAQEQVELDKRDIVFRFQDRLSQQQQFFIFAFAVTLFVAFIAGYSHAKDITTFETISTNPKMAVLQFAGGNFIASPYSTSTLQLSGKLFVISEQEISQNSYYLTREKIGNLIPQ